MPFSLKLEGPATDTSLTRRWPAAQTPPSTVDVEFTPATGTQSLEGSPANLFVNATPPAGQRLVARLGTPSSGNSKTYTLTVTPSDTSKEKVDVVLHWG